MGFPTKSDLVTAIVSTIASGIAAIPLYAESTRHSLFVSAFGWAPIWAMTICTLDLRTVVSEGIRSIIAASFDAYSGLFVVWISGFVSSEENMQYIASALFLLPFASVLMACHPDCKLPISRLARWDVGLICLFSVGAFGKGKSNQVAWNITAGYALGSVCSIVCVMCARWLFGSSEFEIETAIVRFRETHARWFSCLSESVAYSSVDNDAEMKEREEDASGSLRQLISVLKAMKRNPFRAIVDFSTLRSLNDLAMAIHATLLGIRGTILRQGYREFELWNRVKSAVTILRYSVQTAFRPNTSEEARCNAKSQLHNDCTYLLEQLVQHGGDLRSSASSGETEVQSRITFSIVSIAQCGFFVDSFLDCIEMKVSTYGFWESVCRHIRTIVSDSFCVSKYKKIQGVQHAVIGLIAQETLAQSLIAVHYNCPSLDIGPYMSWTYIAFMICYLPTVGQSVTRGTRRFLGTVLGCAVGAITAVANDTNDQSLYTQMLLVVFAGKLMSHHKFVGYAGLVFGLTWIFECTPPSGGTSSDVLLKDARNRSILMVAGVGLAFTCTWLVFAEFSADSMRRVMSRTIVKASEIVAEKLEHVTQSVAQEQPQLLSFQSSTNVASGTEALLELHNKYATLAGLCAEAKPEDRALKLLRIHRHFGAFTLRNIIQSEAAVYRLVDSTITLVMMLSWLEGNLGLGDELREEIRRLGMEIRDKCSQVSKFLLEADSSNSAETGLIRWEPVMEALSSYVSECAPLQLATMHTMIFALHEFFVSSDELVHSLQPNIRSMTRRSKTGIAKTKGVRFSVVWA